MKPIHIIASLGLTLIIGVGGWYMQMQSTPEYQEKTDRAIDMNTAEEVSAARKGQPLAAPAPAAAPVKVEAPKPDAAAAPKPLPADAPPKLGEIRTNP